MGNDIQPIVIKTAFAYDTSGNGEIEKEEILDGFAGLDKFDRDGSRTLKGEEFDGIYYQLGENKWAPAGKPFHEKTDNMLCTYTLKEVDLRNGSLALDIRCNFIA